MKIRSQLLILVSLILVKFHVEDYQANERESGFPRPDKYNNYYVNQYSIPKSFACGKREDLEVRKKKQGNNCFINNLRKESFQY
jgi:hypothetical protein